MKVVRRSGQTEIETETCGLLTEVINSKDVPISIVLAENLQPTKPHYHKKAVEIYWVLEGEVELIVTKGSEKKEVKLQNGDLVVIEKKEAHQVISASENNIVIVINSPPWEKSDEYLENFTGNF